MKRVEKILNKKYGKPLIAQKAEKKKFLKIKEYLQTYQIPCEEKTDCDILQYEIIYESLLVKRKLEEVFLDTYVNMHDYWNDLTYVERKRQMNLDINRVLASFKKFYVGDEMICMPCFEAEFNHLYTTEIVLLDLKQYHTYIRTFANNVKQNLYGVLPYEHGFSSCNVLAQDETGFVLYHPTCSRLYHYKEHRFHSYLSFDPNCALEEENEAVIKQIAVFMLLEDESQMIDLILASHLIKEKMKKKLFSYQKKLEKNIHKE